MTTPKIRDGRGDLKPGRRDCPSRERPRRCRYPAATNKEPRTMAIAPIWEIEVLVKLTVMVIA